MQLLVSLIALQKGTDVLLSASHSQHRCLMCSLMRLQCCRAAKQMMEARSKAAAQEAAAQQQRRTLAIMRHRQLFSEQARRPAVHPHQRVSDTSPCCHHIPALPAGRTFDRCCRVYSPAAVI